MSAVFSTQRYAVADGVSVAADVGGDPAAPAVLLLHGGGQTRHSWAAATTALVAGGFHVISLDARGHGDSDWSPDGDYSIDTLADDLRAVIATLPAPPALVGASMGGASALHAVGSSAPTLARALVLVDIVPRIEAKGASKIINFMLANPQGFATLDEAVDAVAAYNPHRPRPRDPAGLMKNLRLRDDGRLYWHWDPEFIKARHAVEPPLSSQLLLDDARRVRIPTLLVRGLQSDIVSDEGVAELRATLPGLEVVDVSGAGHMVAGDKNDAFNAAVLSFLARHLRHTPS